MKINIKNNQFKALLECVSKDKTRPYLQGIYFDFDEESIVSTDGHILTCLKMPIAKLPCDSFILEVSAELKEIVRKNDVVIDLDGEIITAGKLMIKMEKINLNYPNWQRAMPTGICKEVSQFRTFGSKILQRLCKIYPDTPLAVQNRQSDQPTEVFPIADDFKNMFSVIMPMNNCKIVSHNSFLDAALDVVAAEAEKGKADAN